MKNKFLFLSLFLMLQFQLSAQIFTKPSLRNFNKQYSIKTTSWLENKLNLPATAYQLTVKTLGKKSNKRFSAGLHLNTSYSENLSSNLSLDLRFGKERFLDFGKEQKWRLFYGLDYLTKLRGSLNNNNQAGSLTLGLAPFAGLQYRINKRLVVYMEASYELGLTGFLSNSRNFQARLYDRFNPLGSIWLGFELFRGKSKK